MSDEGFNRCIVFRKACLIAVYSCNYLSHDLSLYDGSPKKILSRPESEQLNLYEFLTSIIRVFQTNRFHRPTGSVIN